VCVLLLLFAYKVQNQSSQLRSGSLILAWLLTWRAAGPVTELGSSVICFGGLTGGVLAPQSVFDVQRLFAAAQMGRPFGQLAEVVHVSGQVTH
jgi:hypothetical protein